MEREKKDNVIPSDPEEDRFCVSSATDCTGLMPRPPLSEEELESYQSLYSMETTVCTKKQK